jgi:hypothetical protein
MLAVLSGAAAGSNGAAAGSSSSEALVKYLNESYERALMYVKRTPVENSDQLEKLEVGGCGGWCFVRYRFGDLYSTGNCTSACVVWERALMYVKRTSVENADQLEKLEVRRRFGWFILRFENTLAAEESMPAAAASLHAKFLSPQARPHPQPPTPFSASAEHAQLSCCPKCRSSSSSRRW